MHEELEIRTSQSSYVRRELYVGAKKSGVQMSLFFTHLALFRTYFFHACACYTVQLIKDLPGTSGRLKANFREPTS